MYCYVEAEFENVNSFRGSLEAIKVTTSCNYCCKYFVPYSYICSVNVALYVNIYTVGTESIQTPFNFSLFVILQPFAKII